LYGIVQYTATLALSCKEWRMEMEDATNH